MATLRLKYSHSRVADQRWSLVASFALALTLFGLFSGGFSWWDRAQPAWFGGARFVLLIGLIPFFVVVVVKRRFTLKVEAF
ncbi:MAG: hypothetical protein KDD42_09400, partial [Bdellovibrionales bacterium]|nr:hypothetical protein [Bdellovibrionales bacterium]